VYPEVAKYLIIFMSFPATTSNRYRGMDNASSMAFDGRVRWRFLWLDQTRLDVFDDASGSSERGLSEVQQRCQRWRW
jgi:hypothetical protein